MVTACRASTVSREAMPPVVSDAWSTSLVPAASVPVLPSTAVVPRSVPTGPGAGVGTGRGRSCALLTAGHANKPPNTAVAKLKRNEFLLRIVTSLFSVSSCLEGFILLPVVRRESCHPIRARFPCGVDLCNRLVPPYYKTKISSKPASPAKHAPIEPGSPATTGRDGRSLAANLSPRVHPRDPHGVTSKASTMMKAPRETGFFDPVTSIANVWLPAARPSSLKTVVWGTSVGAYVSRES